jgi:hypothetical protein
MAARPSGSCSRRLLHPFAIELRSLYRGLVGSGVKAITRLWLYLPATGGLG